MKKIIYAFLVLVLDIILTILFEKQATFIGIMAGALIACILFDELE